MEHNKEKNEQYLSVPQFGDWDQKGVIPDYSMDSRKFGKLEKRIEKTQREPVLETKKSSSIQPNENQTMSTITIFTINQTILQR